MDPLSTLRYNCDNEIHTHIQRDTKNDIVNAVVNEMEKSLNVEIDKIIEKRVEEFRSELIHQKNLAIYGLLNGLTISTSPDFESNGVNINISLTPRLGRFK